MPRHHRVQRRRLHRAVGIALVLVLVVTPGLASTAAAAPPQFLGTFTSPNLCSPRGVGLLPSGDVLVGSDCVTPHMERFTAVGGFVGSWLFSGDYLGPPNGVAVDGSGNVFVTDTEGNRVLKLTSAGVLITSWATPSQPADIAMDAAGNVYVLAFGNGVVSKYTNGGALLTTIGTVGSGLGQLQAASGIAVDASGRLYVADITRMRILRFLANGTFDMEFVATNEPTDVAPGPDGNVYVTVSNTSQLRQYSSSGVLLFSWISGLELPYRIVISPTGALYISEQINNRISLFQIDAATSTSRSTFGRLKALYR